MAEMSLPGGPECAVSLFGLIVEQLGAAKLLRDGRVAVEKPFGHDLALARELNARLHRLLRESQILRVDHFLGKERSSSWSTCASPTSR